MSIQDYKTFDVYSKFANQIKDRVEYKNMVNIYGTNSNRFTKIFRDRVDVLKLTYKQMKQQSYMYYFPQALFELLPDLSHIYEFDSHDRQWSQTRDRLSRMARFEDWFIVLDSGPKNRHRPIHTTSSSISSTGPLSPLGDSSNTCITATGRQKVSPNSSKLNPYKNWFEHPHMDLIEDRRIPHELLKSNEANELFLKHKLNLQRQDRKLQLQNLFKNWYNENQIKPGTLWKDLNIPENETFYNNLDIERFYSEFRNEKIEEIKSEFLELLKEKVIYTKKRSQDININLMSDHRWHAFNKLESERDIMIDNFVSQVKGEKLIDNLYDWYSSKGLPSKLLENLKMEVKIYEKKIEADGLKNKSREEDLDQDLYWLGFWWELCQTIWVGYKRYIVLKLPSFGHHETQAIRRRP